MDPQLAALLAQYLQAGKSDPTSGASNPLGYSPQPTTTPPSGATSASTVLQGSGMGLDTLGKGLAAYGQYQDAQDAADEAKKVQQHDWAREYGIDQGNEQDRLRRGLIDSGNYAGNSIEDLLKRYGEYNSRIGR